MRIAEKTPELVAAVEILHCISLEAKVFQSYRDGRDQTVAFLEFNLRLFRDEFLCACASFADYAGFLPGIRTGLSLRLVSLRGLVAEITCKRGPT